VSAAQGCPAACARLYQRMASALLAGTGISLYAKP